jgi:hypothetical protein
MDSQEQSSTEDTIAKSPFTPCGDPNVMFSVPLATMINDNSISPAAKRVFEENRPLPSAALLPEANNRYPLLTTDGPPFPYIDPTLLTSPTRELAQLGMSCRVLQKLPVVTARNLSVGLHKALKKKPGPRPPIYHAPTVQIIAPPMQTAAPAGSASAGVASITARFGNMGPPPQSLKRKWEN